MALSDYASDEDIINQIRLHFEDEQQYDMEFRTILNNVVDTGKTFYLEFRGKKFNIDKITGSVIEINPKGDD